MTTTLTPRPTPGDSSWFTQARLGLFIHWSLFAMGARHHWQQQTEATPPDEYAARYFPRFDPDLYDPEAWADAAASAGMRYVVVVTKHQEGFCLWDTALTDFKAPNAPAGRDLLKPLVDAFRARGMRIGMYYSLIDWNHPQFAVDSLHPLGSRDDREALNAARDMAAYREFVRGQIRELLTDFGPIDIFWPDFSYDDVAANFGLGDDEADAMAENPELALYVDGKGAADWDSASLLQMARELHPGILVNDRLGLRDGWDITPIEHVVPPEWPQVDGEPALWELCQTFAMRWGYTRDEESQRKSARDLLAQLIEVVGKGGNMLLNVGPTARGEFDPGVLARLAEIGEWTRVHGRSIYSCTQAPAELLPTVPDGMRATYDPQANRLYLHLLEWPTQPIVVPGLADRVAYAQMLHDGSELLPPTELILLLQRPAEDALFLEAPRTRPHVAIPVIELFLKEER